MALVPKVSGRNNYFGDSKYLPSIIPDDFPNKEIFINYVEKLFYNELDENVSITPKLGVDKTKAFKTINTILRSFTREHNEKIHGCAYLMWMWFEIDKPL